MDVVVDVVVERCAGLDVHRDTVVATVRTPAERGGERGGRGRRKETRTFATTTAGLLALADRLDELGVTLVGMEATGVYWKPVFYVLENRFEAWLLNAHHLRAVPGRKTDVADSAWIAQLLEHGLVRPSRGASPSCRRARSASCATRPARRLRAGQRARPRPAAAGEGAARRRRQVDVGRLDRLRRLRPRGAGRAR